MISLRLYDKNFFPDLGSSKYWPPKEVTWLRHGPNTAVTFYTDRCLDQVANAGNGVFRVAWLLEPEEVYPDPYRYVEAHHDRFDLVLTHHSSMLRHGPKFVLYPNCMTWVYEHDWHYHQKSRDISIIASSQNMTTGHKLRHELIRAIGSQSFDLYGHAYRPVVHKIEALAPYRFSVVIENTKVPGWYFTEKIVDCFATFTVPIYWGCMDIGQLFDTSGIVIASSLDALRDSVEMVRARSVSLYESMSEAMKKNHATARDLAAAEDWIVNNVLRAKGLV